MTILSQQINADGQGNLPHGARPRIHCVDLFCGLGGLTHGLLRGGIRVVAGVDVDPDCRFAYETNNGAQFVQRSVRDLTGPELIDLFGESERRLLAGCAPCQPFSTYSQKTRKNRDDPKWDLAVDFGRLVSETVPDLVTMENVPQLQDHPVFTEFLESLTGYSVWHGIVECAQYCVPQTRKRLVLLASRLGPINLIGPSDPEMTEVTVRSAIGHLPPIAAGEADQADRLHTSSRLSELNLRRIRASLPGGTWRDWDQSLLAACHKKVSGETYPSVYGRMQWDAPAPTITTQCFGYGNGRFGHPEQDRAISLREAAILQTFPEHYQFLAAGERPRFSKFGRLIGNAVPVRLGEVVAASILEHLANFDAQAISPR
jgi:DNA (cytosine-5)-methyltransferase 1